MRLSKAMQCTTTLGGKMVIRAKQQREVVIDLTGPDGNAFALLAYAKQYSRQLDLDHKKIQSEMMSGDYEHLLEVFDKYFGEYVVLER